MCGLIMNTIAMFESHQEAGVTLKLSLKTQNMLSALIPTMKMLKNQQNLGAVHNYHLYVHLR